MDGLAESVEVLRSAIPAGTGIELRHVNKGGRPRYDDSRHIAQALAIIDLDGVPARVAIARVAPRMQPGTIMTSLKALKGRLRPQLQRALKARKPAL